MHHLISTIRYEKNLSNVIFFKIFLWLLFLHLCLVTAIVIVSISFLLLLSLLPIFFNYYPCNSWISIIYVIYVFDSDWICSMPWFYSITLVYMSMFLNIVIYVFRATYIDEIKLPQRYQMYIFDLYK